MIRSRLAAKFFLMLTMVFAVTGGGCGTSEPPKAGAEAGTSIGESKEKGQTYPGGFVEATAKEKLKIALDSWVFGDDEKKLAKNHPGIDFSPRNYLLSDSSYDIPVLQKFEIGPGRTDQEATKEWPGFEFPVTLTIHSQAGTEIKQRHIFSVRSQDNTKWSIVRKSK